jgi:hypothetical protein
MVERWLRFEPVAFCAAMLPLLPNQGFAPPLILVLFGSLETVTPAVSSREHFFSRGGRGARSGGGGARGGGEGRTFASAASSVIRCAARRRLCSCG